MRCIGDAFSLCLLSDVVETGGAIGPACQSNAAQSVDVTCDVLVTQNANQNAKSDRFNSVFGPRRADGGGLIKKKKVGGAPDYAF